MCEWRRGCDGVVDAKVPVDDVSGRFCAQLVLNSFAVAHGDNELTQGSGKSKGIHQYILAHSAKVGETHKDSDNWNSAFNLGRK